MYKLIIPKHVAVWDTDVDAYIGKSSIDKEWWLLLYEHMDIKLILVKGTRHYSWLGLTIILNL